MYDPLGIDPADYTSGDARGEKPVVEAMGAAAAGGPSEPGSRSSTRGTSMTGM